MGWRTCRRRSVPVMRARTGFREGLTRWPLVLISSLVPLFVVSYVFIQIGTAVPELRIDALEEGMVREVIPGGGAEILVDRQGRPEPDTDLRDYERVPLDRSVEDYVAEEVQPYVPDAWVDEDYVDEKDGGVGRVGYEINFNRYFYEYDPPRPLEEIEADIRKLQDEILEMLVEVTK